MTPEDHFQAGHLSEAVQAATEQVRNRPSDVPARSLLCELLCFAGEFERADRQLDTIAELDRDSVQGVSLLRHLIRSEYSRQEVFEQGRVPAFLGTPGESQQKRLEALLCLREGRPADAGQLLAEAAESAAEVTGTINGQAFAGFSDLDDLLGPTLEFFTATGKYFWIDCSQIISLELNPVEHLSDMLWRGGRIQTTGDVSGRIHIPVLYHGSRASADPRVRIGRATEWDSHGDAGVVTGRGQREFLVGDEAIPLLQINELTFGGGGVS